MIIYKATNKVSGKCYIGQTVKTLENRIYHHISNSKSAIHKSIFHNALKSYGSDNFEWEVIATADTKEQLNELEIYYITKYDSINTGYNMVEGGTGGYNQFAVDANKLKRAGKTWNEIYSDTGLAVMKNALSTFTKAGVEYIKNLPKEQRIINAKRANKARTDMGYKHSDATKDKMSKAQKGITNTDRYGEDAASELKKKISEATKEAMKKVDRDLIGRKSVEARTPFWNKKHENDRNVILEMTKLGSKIKDIMFAINVSPPTYYKRVNELKNMGYSNLFE